MDASNNAPDDDAAAGFAQSVAYLKQLAGLYQESFTARKPVAKAHVQEAQRQAREALELLAGNLLNASNSLLATIEAQDAAVEALNERLQGIKETLRDRRRQADEQIIQRFYSQANGGQEQISGPVHYIEDSHSPCDLDVDGELNERNDES